MWGNGAAARFLPINRLAANSTAETVGARPTGYPADSRGRYRASRVGRCVRGEQAHHRSVAASRAIEVRHRGRARVYLVQHLAMQSGSVSVLRMSDLGQGSEVPRLSKGRTM